MVARNPRLGLRSSIFPKGNQQGMGKWLRKRGVKSVSALSRLTSSLRQELLKQVVCLSLGDSTQRVVFVSKDTTTPLSMSLF